MSGPLTFSQLPQTQGNMPMPGSWHPNMPLTGNFQPNYVNRYPIPTGNFQPPMFNPNVVMYPPINHQQNDVYRYPIPTGNVRPPVLPVSPQSIGVAPNVTHPLNNYR